MPYVGAHRRPGRRPAPWWAVAAVAVAFAGTGSLVAIDASNATTTTTLTSVADSYVSASKPTTNYGSQTQVRVDGSPVQRGYLKFAVSGTSAGVATATLRLHANSSTSAGISVSLASSSAWTETAITYNNAPGFGAAIASTGKISSGTWVSVDVSQAISGDGTYTFVVTTKGTTAVGIASRESGAATAPQLQVTPTAPSPSATPSTSSASSSTATSMSASSSTAAASSSSAATSTATSASPTATATDTTTSPPGSPSDSPTDTTSATQANSPSDSSTPPGSSTPSSSTPSPTSTGSSGPCAGTGVPSSWDHVIWVVMENHSYSEVIGNSAAPYETSLAGTCATATAYHGVTHPSLPNYLAMTGGSTFGVTDDNPPSSHPISAASIFSQVTDSGRQWRSYEETMPSNCALSSSGNYAVKHNPAAYYTGIASDCSRWDVPLGTTTSGALQADLANDTLPAFSFITPDLCHDDHNCSVTTGDNWLAQWLPMIFASPAYQAGRTAVFVTFDEDDSTASNTVPFIAAAPSVTPGTVTALTFDHYSLLRTTEEMLGLPTAALGNAATAASMRGPLGL